MATMEWILERCERKGPDECWPWLQGINDAGYGVFRDDDGELVYAHRAMFAAAVGPVPDGFEVMHSCDTPRCINPQHLSVGTHADNMADMRAKGRHKWGERPKGEAHQSAKLTQLQVDSIRSDPRGCVKLARQYGVSTTQIKNIRAGKSWKP